MKNEVIFQDLGQISYQQAWNHQQCLLEEVIAIKKINRQQPNSSPQKHYLIFCEHPPVYTLGRSGSKSNLLLNEEQLTAGGFEFFKINRGGDITYHGLGQIVAYPIFDLDCFFTDVHRYIRYLEEIVIKMLIEYGIVAGREEGFTGVWLEANSSQPKRKICAIGVHLSRWVTMHGFALNVNTNLAHFANIIPCGIEDKDKTITSMQQELGTEIDIQEVKNKLLYHFAQQFDYDYAPAAATMQK